MKDLEDRAKPVLLPLICGKETRLTSEQQRTVAAWAVLKTMVANHDVVPLEHLEHMHNQHQPPPESWGVWIGDFKRVASKGEWATRLFTMLPNAEYAARESPEVDFSNSSATTFVLNRLLIHVAHCPDVHFGHEWDFDRHLPLHGKLRRIWPAAPHASIMWPPKALSDSEATAIADVIIKGVMRIADHELAAKR